MNIKILKIKKWKVVRAGLITTFKLYTDEENFLYYFDWREDKLLASGLMPVECIKMSSHGKNELPYVVSKWDRNKTLDWTYSWEFKK